jgi:uncharacterized protein
MKLQPDQFDVQSVTGHGPGWVAVNGERIAHSVIIASTGERLAWPCTQFERLGPDHFAQLAQFDVEVVIFGSGQRLRFVPPAWQQGLMQRRIGMETMDTAAACRTYNILAGEGRRVLAALLVENPH